VSVGLVHANSSVCLALQNELDGALDFVRSHTESLLACPQRCWPQSKSERPAMEEPRRRENCRRQPGDIVFHRACT
jgi:hypothetical protein